MTTVVAGSDTSDVSSLLSVTVRSASTGDGTRIMPLPTSRPSPSVVGSPSVTLTAGSPETSSVNSSSTDCPGEAESSS